MSKKLIQVEISGTNGKTAYVMLPGHPGRGTGGCIDHTVRVDSLLPDFKGPWVALDFDHQNELIGIEIIVFGAPDGTSDDQATGTST